jgi:hypothetical protein
MKTNTSDEVDECLLYIESSPPSQLVKSTGSHSMTYYRNRELPVANEKDHMGDHGLINHLVGITRQQKTFTGPPASEYVVQ